MCLVKRNRNLAHFLAMTSLFHHYGAFIFEVKVHHVRAIVLLNFRLKTVGKYKKEVSFSLIQQMERKGKAFGTFHLFLLPHRV